MSDLTIEPEATTVTPENKNEAGTTETSVELVLTAEQRADAEKVITLNNEIGKAGNQFILNKFALAFLLIVLRKKYKELFWTVLDTTNISRKTLERAIFLVLKNESEFSQAMSNDGAEKDIAKNVKLLVIDERIEALDIKTLSKIHKPTLVKIGNMKKLSDKDWAIVIGGSDTPYKDYMGAEAKKAADKKAEADKVKAKQILADKPSSMDTNTYLKYIQKDKLISIEKIAELEKDLEFFKDILSKNNLLPKKDSELSEIPTEGKLSAVSKSESGEK